MTTMDFFGRQEEARRNTRKLVFYFALAVITIALLLYVAALLLFAGLDETAGGSGGWFQPGLLAIVLAGTLVVVGCGALFKVAQLRQGGSAVAQLLGGRPVQPNTEDHHERQLLNVVEEMSIASGVPVPAVYVLDNERGINAFAAGYTPGDAAIAVTRGTLEQMNRDELQGVIAHEFSHVFNGDMRLNIRLMGTLFGITCIAMAGYVVLRGGASGAGYRSRGRGGGAMAVLAFGLAMLVIGWTGVFFSRLIKAAVSRQREFLADAAAVQFTRNPRGIGGALIKIAGYQPGTKVKSGHAEEASHMFFAHGIGKLWFNAMATHPPIDERIERVLPGFATGRAPLWEEGAATEDKAAAGAAGFAAGAPRSRARSEDLVARVGDPQPEHVRHARALLRDLPLSLTAAARDPFSARCLVFALLLDEDREVRRRQLELLRERRDERTAYEANALAPEVRSTPVHARLPLLELALPALRGLSPEQYSAFREDARLLAEADEELTTFEFALLKVMQSHLQAHHERPGRRKPGIRLTSAAPYAGLVLSALAYRGHPEDPEAASKTFREGAALLGDAGADLSITPADQCALSRLDAALDRLVRLAPVDKRRLLLAGARAVASDGLVEAEEAELLRAVAEALGCPMPPVPAEIAQAQPA